MEYYLFFEDVDEHLHQIGYVNGTGMESEEIVDELFRMISKYIKEDLHIEKTFYYNIWNHDGFTIVDYGSHSQFFKIRPTILPT